MRKQSLFFALTAISFCIAVWACNKAKNSPAIQDKTQVLKIISHSMDFPCDFPASENGMLVFNDANHYQCYYDFLTDAIQADTTGMDVDSALLNLETAMGYTSLRSVALAKFEEMNETGWPTSEEIPDEDWIASRIERSILNTNREMKIGGIVEKYLSPRYIVEVDAEQPELLNGLRELPENFTVEDIIALDESREYINIASMKNLHEVYPAENKPTGPDPSGGGVNPAPLRWRISGTTFEPSHCNAPGVIRFSGFTVSQYLVPQKCKYHINYGDGTSTGTALDPDRFSTLGNNQSILDQVDHQYAPGNYTATVSVKSISPYNSGTTTVISRNYAITISPPSITCTYNKKEKWTVEGLGSDKSIKGYICYEAWYSFLFHAPRTRISGYTELHAIDNNGSWNRVKNKQTSLCVKLYQTVADASCNTINRDYPSEQCSKNTNRKEMEHYILPEANQILSLKKLIGIHSFNITGGTQGSMQQSISVCE